MFHVFKVYATLNILLVIASSTIFLVTYFHKNWKFSDQLYFTYVLLLSLIFMPFIGIWGRSAKFMSPSSQEFLAINSGLARFAGQTIRSGATHFRSASESWNLFYILFACVLLGSFAMLLKAVIGIRSLQCITKSAFVLKRYRTVRVLVSDKVSVPFSFWFPFHNCVVLPECIVFHAQKQRMAIAHEMQHHRQGDTKLLYLMQTLKVLCFWNPFVYVLERTLSHLQEFACDEALVGQRGFSSLAYCRCLLWVAEKSLQNPYPLVGTLSMVGGSAQSLLKRRMERMLTPRIEHFRRFFLLAIGTASLTGMLGVAFAASPSIQDRKISFEEAQQMLELTQQKTDFPVVVNDLVLEQLNHFLGTADGREYMRASLTQMKNHEGTVFSAIQDYKFPMELAAIPIVESGYRNLTQSENPVQAAGIWQFIPSTARNFGLQVDEEKDQRLDVASETDAAMRLLGALNLQFQDWGLALLAYNGGSELVQRGIQETGSRDVWKLLKEGYEGDPAYLAKVMASILIMANPAHLDL